MNICPRCRGKLIETSGNGQRHITCLSCGWEFNADESAAILRDQTLYEIILSEGNEAGGETMRFLSQITGSNYYTIKTMIETAPNFVIQAEAPLIAYIRDELTARGTLFTIQPEFKY